MQTVVLAAGAGTRLRPLTETVPKPMLPVAEAPILAHTLETAVEAGADHLRIVVGYEQSAIRDRFGGSIADTPITYVEQPTQRGTADAVRAASGTLDDDPFAVLMGDALYDVDSVRRVFESGPSVGTYRVDDPSAYGVLELSESGSRVTGIQEKPTDPPSDLVNTGAYVFPAEALDWLDVPESERGELELTDVLARTCSEYAVTPVTVDRWLDVGRPWDLLAANEWKLSEIQAGKNGDVHPDAEITGPVAIESGATIRSGVVIEGPTLVRSGATVGPNAYLRGSTLIDEDVHIGHAVEIKNSVVMKGATVGHLSYVGDSLLGPAVNLGAGTTVANLRHDGEPVRMQVKGEVVSTGRRKFGCVCGPGAKTGINTSLNAGVTLGAGETTQPGETVMWG